MIYSLNHYRTPKNLDNCYTFKSVFSDEACDKIIEIGEALPTEDGQAGGQVNKDFRNSKISWIAPHERYLAEPPINPEAPAGDMYQEYNACWIYEKLAALVYKANAESWQFQIDGFREKLQYTRYEHDPDDPAPAKFDAHLDLGGTNINRCRKISAVVQLSGSNAYEGGDLEIHRSDSPMTATRERGSVTLFPSYLMHRVTAVTGGKRSSLVVWLSGEPFR